MNNSDFLPKICLVIKHLEIRRIFFFLRMICYGMRYIFIHRNFFHFIQIDIIHVFIQFLAHFNLE